MGKGGGGVGVEKKRKKKKGRPSLLDLQKRTIKQQHLIHKQILKNQHKFKLLKHPSNPTNSNYTNSSSRRSTRRNPLPATEPEAAVAAVARNGAVKKDKKLKLVHDLPVQEDGNCGGEEEEEESGDEAGRGRNRRKRKIESISCGSVKESVDKVEKKQSVAVTDQTNTQQEPKQEDGPLTPLPDKKLLLFVLDRLQKKDTYGVFGEPVDPEELPDYFEVIDHPMDFGTVRKKLESSAYTSLEQFEKDVFLICSNAMQYNAPDTIYFRQARSIEELAKKNFDNLRQDSDDNELEPEPKVVRRGRPPTKNLKRPLGRPPLERAKADFSEANLASAGGTTNRSNSDLRKGPSHLENYGSPDSLARSVYGSRNSEAYTGLSADRYERADDFSGSASKGILMKLGKKQILLDESRRSTYQLSCELACRHESSVLTTFQRERKQLIAVGLHTEYGYARSLARFAAKLGPVAWKVASRKIERCVPSAIKFGPGWVGENDSPAERPLQQLPDASGQPSTPASIPAHADSSSTPEGVVESSGDKPELKPQVEKLSESRTTSLQPKLENESNEAVTPAAESDGTSVSCVRSNGAGPNLITPAEGSERISLSSMVNLLSSSSGSMRSGPSLQFHQVSTNQTRINGINGSYGLNFAAQMGKMIGAARPTMSNFPSNPSIVTVSRAESQSIRPPSIDNDCAEAKLPVNSNTVKATDCLPKAEPHQKVSSKPPDLNVGFKSPGSPGSVKADSVQPDLALQL